MADTSIEWTDKTWNPVRGCSMVSKGCSNCYAMKFAHRFNTPGGPYEGLTRLGANGPVWTGKVRLVLEKINDPYKWRKPARVFVNSMSDLFHEDVPFGFVMRCLKVMAETPQHTYQILTKRPERMCEFFTRWADLSGEDFEFKNARGPEATRKAHPSGRGQLFADMLEAMGEPPGGCAYPLFDWMEGMITWPDRFANIWLGTSVEDQQRADERIRPLLDTPAAVRFLSVEPLLGPVNLGLHRVAIPKHREHWPTERVRNFWVITGCESGPGARPMDDDWVRSIRDQCIEAGVPFFFKQKLIGGRKVSLPELDGRQWAEFPNPLSGLFQEHL